MIHSRGVSSVQAVAAEPPVARKAGTGVLTAARVSSLILTLFSASGILLIVLLRRFRARRPQAADFAAATAVTKHTIPVPQDE
jgi:hypothetical protein